MPLPLTHEQAEALLKEHTKTESLQRHAYAVEAAMRHFAQLQGEDVEYWGMVGLLHDLDYEQYPELHCQKTPEFLREAGFDDAFIHAVLSHGYGLCTDAKPELFMEKVIYTVDELTGFITACALMRPSKSVMDMEVKSVKKKFKDARFAAKVNRELIKGGCELMGMEFDQVVRETIEALKPVCEKIGLETI